MNKITWSALGVIAVVGSALIWVLSIIGVVSITINELRSDQPITPTIEVHCTDQVCDTTWIYKVKQ